MNIKNDTVTFYKGRLGYLKFIYKNRLFSKWKKKNFQINLHSRLTEFRLFKKRDICPSIKQEIKKLKPTIQTTEKPAIIHNAERFPKAKCVISYNENRRPFTVSGHCLSSPFATQNVTFPDPPKKSSFIHVRKLSEMTFVRFS